MQYDRLTRAAVLAGDEGAWRTWYDQTYDGLYQYVLWRCGGRHDWADEVVQETWMTAVRRIRRFDPARASFAAWLRGIATNVLRNHVRRHMTRKRHIQPLDGSPVVDGSNGRPIEQEERSRRIMRTLATLPDQYEAVLRAKYVDRQTTAQIAEVGGETIKAVESRLGRARAAFRKTYEKFESNGKPTELNNGPS